MGPEGSLSSSEDGTVSETGAAAPASRDSKPCRLENVALAAKIFVPSTQAQIDGVVTDLSTQGATIATTEGSSMGVEIALYIDGFDRFSAFLVSASQEQVRVKFHCSALKQARTAEKIRRYLQGNSEPASTLQNAPGWTIHSVRKFKRSNGQIARFEVIDISLTGASLRTSSRPLLGEVVSIGAVQGRVVRHFDDGIAVEFFRRASPAFDSAD